jgi:hypothetical protein
MPDFSSITAICVDTLNHELALAACGRMAAHGFADLVLVTDDGIDPYEHAGDVPAGLRIERIPALRSRKAYSEYVMRHLGRHVHTPHTLIFQWDGFVLDPALWRPEFLEYDYVGGVFPPDARWGSDRRVGNGGFCLRSARLMRAVAEAAPADTGIAEDWLICRVMGGALEGSGMRFAPPELAMHFSVDMVSLSASPEPHLVAERTFGFHGFCNFHLVFTDDELLELVDTRLNGFREELLTSRPTAALMVNLAMTGRAPVAQEIARRSARLLGMDLGTASLQDVVARCEMRHVG